MVTLDLWADSFNSDSQGREVRVSYSSFTPVRDPTTFLSGVPLKKDLRIYPVTLVGVRVTFEGKNLVEKKRDFDTDHPSTVCTLECERKE